VGGKYTIPSRPGLAPGSYKVAIGWNKPTGKKVGTPGDPGTTVDETAQVIPPKYNTQTTLTAEIKSGSNTVDFVELKSR
jgi:hypothetical protein